MTMCYLTLIGLYFLYCANLLKYFLEANVVVCVHHLTSGWSLSQMDTPLKINDKENQSIPQTITSFYADFLAWTCTACAQTFMEIVGKPPNKKNQNKTTPLVLGGAHNKHILRQIT